MSELSKLPEQETSVVQRFHWWDFSPELLIECAPLGKTARLVHYHIAVKPLPAAFVGGVMMSLIPGFIITGAILYNQNWLMEQLGQFALSPANMVVWAVLLIALGLLIPILFQPTHIGVGRRGIRLHWRRTLLGQHASSWLSWEALTRVHLVQPTGTTLAEQQILCFSAGNRNVKVKVGQIVEPEQFPLLWEAITFLGKDVPRDFELAGLLGESSSKNNSYTELWLKALAAPPERDRLTPLPPGAALKDGEYTVIGRLGAGGQGVAYTASRRHMIRAAEEVVLKEYVLPIQVSRAARTQAVDRLEKEARILETIKHPRIVKLIDFFFEDHRGYLVLEHVSGTPLSTIVRTTGAMPEGQVVELALQMCDMLAYLHMQTPPVIHRDFTPDNLILSKEGMLKLIDFNVAEQRTSTTTTATVVGKHAFIAPEQFRGKPVPQSDLYSLGATMYYLLCGRDPKPISVSHPKLARPQLSDRIDEIVARCTAINTSQRVESATQLKEQLLEKQV